MVKILESVKGCGVLTIADTPGFLEAGCMINLVMDQKKVRFEINPDIARHEGFTIRSKLLRLATRVVRSSNS